MTGYNVYRSSVSGGYYGLLGNVSGITYTDKNVQSGATYFYVLKAVNTFGLLSAFSNQVQAKIP